MKFIFYFRLYQPLIKPIIKDMTATTMIMLVLNRETLY